MKEPCDQREVANLKNFRRFYLTYPDQEKSYTLCTLLSWSHIRLIMRYECEKERQYYIKELSLELGKGYSYRNLAYYRLLYNM